ncbi:MAG: hypothetical protein C4527_20570 [Candidatus Omnitrophota bacterium]|jgi:hypothetical protein|nr:MAG: hypothetical protein C4527_20570 [Candidatus Omnitrophota bacterium]
MKKYILLSILLIIVNFFAFVSSCYADDWELIESLSPPSFSDEEDYYYDTHHLKIVSQINYAPSYTASSYVKIEMYDYYPYAFYAQHTSTFYNIQWKDTYQYNGGGDPPPTSPTARVSGNWSYSGISYDSKDEVEMAGGSSGSKFMAQVTGNGPNRNDKKLAGMVESCINPTCYISITSYDSPHNWVEAGYGNSIADHGNFVPIEANPFFSYESTIFVEGVIEEMQVIAACYGDENETATANINASVTLEPF